ncbi:LamG-like jellyroll fold domain-containing protein [Fimbriimonas ginsengisoli]|uniref:BIG2 domain-containing protein n=1 Tax=Fimbriimonas ginsengisoli Gsoil 348 TaxID=661478 RepID=A0A068NW22_FIMGI|nr:LamG-like jellyroll fold domain-containing protein [Fimbriimonas ginsengisoli]AIE87636.1 hypothetical protein OP10G_4268 [Fimbriimonas ginsengisoli Gsoil 348]
MLRWLWFAFVLALVLAGCGGSGRSNGPVTANRTMQITWPARSRAALTAPASALSARIVIVAGDSTGHDIAFTVNREARIDGYVATYTIPQPVNRTARTLTVSFYAQANGLGDLVATAQANFTSQGPNLNFVSVVVDGKVHTVTATPQTMLLSQGAKQLEFTASDADSHTVAVSPGSATWSLISGESVLSVSADGIATPLSVGTATVKVTVDGVSSPPATITVDRTFTRVFRFALPTDTIQLKGGDLNGACNLGQRFTVEAIVKPARADSRTFIWQQWANGSMDEIFVLDPDRFVGMGTGAGQPYRYYYGDQFPLHAWSHMAWCYDGQVVRMYRNGHLVSTTPATGNITPLANAEAAALGKNCGVPFVTQDFSFVGDLAAFRISNVDRYTGESYDVPTKPWEDDASTLVLVDPSTLSGTPTNFSIPGIQHLNGTLGGGSSSATSPTWEAYSP